MKKHVFSFLLAGLFVTRLMAGVQPSSMVPKKAELGFQENKGQVVDQFQHSRKDIQFKFAAASGLTVFIGDGAMHYQFLKTNGVSSKTKKGSYVTNKMGAFLETVNYDLYRMDVELLGANKNAEVITEGKNEYFEKYFTISSQPNGVIVNMYNKVVYKDIYPNIDWVLYTYNNQLKHEFVVRPGGKVSDIQLKYNGVSQLNLMADGSLQAITPMGTINEQAPVSYIQNSGKYIQSSFRLNGNVLSYTTAEAIGTLVIDPTIAWGTYFGSSDEDGLSCIKTDANSNIYACGFTYGQSNIATTGSYQSTSGGTKDSYIVKFDKDGKRLWATYYGGGNEDDASAICIDNQGNLYLFGITQSSTGMATANAFQTGMNSSIDNYIVKFDNNMNRIWGTYYGGDGFDFGGTIITDNKGGLYVSGVTYSRNGITTANAHQPNYGGGLTDGFLAKFDTAGARVWATYVGGDNGDIGGPISLDAAGNIYMTGTAQSAMGFATANAFQKTLGGGEDAFLVKFDKDGNQIWGTYYGGAGADRGYAISVDAVTADIYFGGESESQSGIASSGANQTTFTGDNDGFLIKFDSTGARKWGTYVGGNAIDAINSLSVDPSGDIYTWGYTESDKGITDSVWHQVSYGGNGDAYIAKFNTSGKKLLESYFGGEEQEQIGYIYTDGFGNIYIGGKTNSKKNISTKGTYLDTLIGNNDAFIVKFACDMPKAGSIIGASSPICPGTNVVLNDTIKGGFWSSLTSNVASIDSLGKVTGVTGGKATIIYVMKNYCGVDTAKKEVEVYTTVLPVISLSGFTLSTTKTYSNYQWKLNDTNITGATNQSYTAVANGDYKVVVTDSNGCSVTSAAQKVGGVGMNQISLLGNINIYPNPNSGMINIESSAVKAMTVTITNLVGQFVSEYKIEGNTTKIDISGLESGVYLIQCKDYEGKTGVVKIVKQ